MPGARVARRDRGRGIRVGGIGEGWDLRFSGIDWLRESPDRILCTNGILPLPYGAPCRARLDLVCHCISSCYIFGYPIHYVFLVATARVRNPHCNLHYLATIVTFKKWYQNPHTNPHTNPPQNPAKILLLISEIFMIFI